jgi:hypothetical protein
MGSPDDLVQKRLEADGWQVLWDPALVAKLLEAGADLPSVDLDGPRWPMTRAAVNGRAYYVPNWFVKMRVQLSDTRRDDAADVHWDKVFQLAKLITDAPESLNAALEAAWRVGGWDALEYLLDELLVEETARVSA